jgi:hypothetical protein
MVTGCCTLFFTCSVPGFKKLTIDSVHFQEMLRVGGSQALPLMLPAAVLSLAVSEGEANNTCGQPAVYGFFTLC